MTAHDLLLQLREKGVEIKTSGDDRLVIDAPKGTITEELRSALSAHKAEHPEPHVLDKVWTHVVLSPHVDALTLQAEVDVLSRDRR